MALKCPFVFFSGAHRHDLTGFQGGQQGQHLWHKWRDVLNFVGANVQHNHREASRSRLLLVNEVLIHSDEGIKVRLGYSQEAAIAQTQPVHLADGLHVVPGKPPAETPAQTLIEQDFHAAVSIRRVRASSKL